MTRAGPKKEILLLKLFVSGVEKKGHTIADCKHDDRVCFNCGEEGHTSPQCKQPKKASTSGKVFALAGTCLH